MSTGLAATRRGGGIAGSRSHLGPDCLMERFFGRRGAIWAKGRRVVCNKLVGRPMEILLIEDSFVQARLAIESLKAGQVKHRMTLVMDGEEALDFLRQRGVFARAPRPDLILLDLRLPKFDGLEVLAEIRSDEALKNIPVVVMTSSPDAEDKRQCEMLDVECYITKPVDMHKFLAIVKQLKKYWQADVILPVLN